MASSQKRKEILQSKESPAVDLTQPSFAGESVTEYFVKCLKEFDMKPRMWDEKDLKNIVIMELLDISQVLVYDPIKLEELIDDTEFFGAYKEVIRLNLEKKMLAFRIEKKEYIKQLLDVKCLNISEDDDESNEFHGSDYLENMKLPVRCYSVNQGLKKAERWWEEKTCVVINKTNIIRFSNDEDLGSSQLNSIVLWSRYMKIKEEYFMGMCQHCCSSTPPSQKLSRCGGCQLVGYCSKECQKADRKQHKEVCKEFSVSHCGVNILRRAQGIVEGINPIEKKKELFFTYLHLVDSNKDFLKNKVSHNELEKTSRMVTECDVDFRFNVLKFPRICNMCCEARLEKLQDCNCNCVTYCSNEHRNADRSHQARCKELGLLAATYAYIRNNGPISDLPYSLQSGNKHWPMENMESLQNSLNSSAKHRVPVNGSSSSIVNERELAEDVTLAAKLALLSERLSLPLTVLSVLTQVGVGPDKTPIENITNLHIHNLCFRPLLDPGAWEFFLHCLPGLKQLHVSFTEEDAAQIYSMSINHLNTNTALTRCQDCIDQDRLITYAIYPFTYEMYISGKYPEPNVITVAECGELIEEELDDTTDFYINLMQHRDCRVIFTDKNHDKLCETISVVNDEVPVGVLIDPKENPFAGFSQVRTTDTKDGGVTILNCRQFVSCLIRNNEKDK